MLPPVRISGPYIGLKNLVASLPSAVCFLLHLNHNNLLRAALVTSFMSANYSERKNTVCRDTSSLSLRVSCFAVVATSQSFLALPECADCRAGCR